MEMHSQTTGRSEGVSVVPNSTAEVGESLPRCGPRMPRVWDFCSLELVWEKVRAVWHVWKPENRGHHDARRGSGMRPSPV
jgi:hypothetical protein